MTFPFSTTRSVRTASLSLCAAVALLAACSTTDDAGPVSNGATGGAPSRASGGSVAAGGEPATGGAASGGVASSGAASNAAGSGNAAGEGGEAPSEPERGPLTAFLAGDSTVSTYADTASPGDQAGWGQMLPAFFDDLVTVDNRAIGGRTSRRFIEEGHLDAIWEDIASGDYLFVQFGTNDGNKSATYELDGQTIPYYLDPSTDFKTYLRKYVDGARERGATPVLVTPPPRNSAYCIGGNGTGGHAQAMRELGAAEDVTVLDLNTQSVEYLKAICPAPTPENFFFLRPNGTVDGTHFQEAGARKLAGIVALELAASELPLAGYLQ